MDDRIHHALDGELPTDQLTPAERAELHRYRAIICRALVPISHLRSIDIAPEVMNRVAPRLVRRSLARLLDWLWSPRPLSLTVRPAFDSAGTSNRLTVGNPVTGKPNSLTFSGNRPNSS